jgi:aspartate aminotransferase
MLEEYRVRRDAMVGLMTADPRLRVTPPSGAFYLFVDVGSILSPDGIRTSADLAQALLDEARVALTAGEAFDAPGFIRISYATSMDRLEEGARRIHGRGGASHPRVHSIACGSVGGVSGPR